MKAALAVAVMALGAGVAATVPARSEESTAPRPGRDAAEKRAYTVAAIGDSLTDYKSHGGGFLRVLEERCPESRFDNYARGGKMVNQMRRLFRRDVFGEAAEPGQASLERPEYTHVLVFGGVNDLYSDLTAGRTPTKIAKDLSQMYGWAHERDISVIAVTVAPWGGFRKYYNEPRGRATRKLNEWIVSRLGVGEVDHVVDAYGLLSCGDPERLCKEYAGSFRDGLHFGKKGHEKLGEVLHGRVFADCR